jgi:hypothetical protein
VLSLLRANGIKVTGTLRLNRKPVSQFVKSKNLAKGESVTAECYGTTVMKWRHIREASFTSTFHDSSMQTQTVRGTEVSKPKCIRQYNLAIGGVNLKDQMVHPYLLERKQAKKWCVKFSKRQVNVAVHNAFVLYNSKNKTLHLTYHLDLIKAPILTHRPPSQRSCWTWKTVNTPSTRKTFREALH